jgi:hypothetical protein
MQKILILINDVSDGTEKAYNGFCLVNQLNKARENIEFWHEI